MIAGIGIDVGSTNTKLALVDASGNLMGSLVEPSEPLIEKQCDSLINRAAAEHGFNRAAIPVLATGYGRKLVAGATRTATEIACHAAGAFAKFGVSGTLIDIGGQDSKVIAIAASGAVTQFAMNDKCAAGTGRFLEMAAARLRIPLEDLGSVALSTEQECKVSSTCAVFADSEIVSLIARGQEVAAILRGLHRALANRVASLARSIGFCPPLMLSGGLALNPAVREFVGSKLDAEPLVPPRPELTGAIGAALIALR